MTKRVYTDRSRIQEYQECNRSRFLAYHQDGLGIRGVRMPLTLAVGLAFHAGMEVLLRYSMDSVTGVNMNYQAAEDSAVQVAITEFRQYHSALDLGTSESTAMIQPDPDTLTLNEQLAGSLGLAADDPSLVGLSEVVGASKSRYDKYLAAEQAALVEGMVRAYSRRRLRPLLEQYEVLEVEREGQWLLYRNYETAEEAAARGAMIYGLEIDDPLEIWFMSRPDALLRDRQSNQLVIQSYKTAGGWDVRKARDAEHDMQGLSEGVEIERRLAEWWDVLHGDPKLRGAVDMNTKSMIEFLRGLDSPPRIHAVRYEHILKGDRWVDKDLSRELQMTVRCQRSTLIRGYFNSGMVAGDEAWNWSWDYLKDTGETSKLYWKTWKSTPVWEHMPIKKWIDMLDDTAMLVDADTGSERGYKSDAQATGFTKDHPLESVFVPPIVVYRNDDDLRDLVEQIEAQEHRVAEGVVAVESATNEADRRHALNVHFPQNRQSCEYRYGTTCMFARICYGGEDIRLRPLDSGLYKPRDINHPQELE